ncbi:putative lipoprotein [Streptomyces malachitofuscus]|nr:putative lipoprotein [Streptomyces malachitofuscus]
MRTSVPAAGLAALLLAAGAVGCSSDSGSKGSEGSGGKAAETPAMTPAAAVAKAAKKSEDITSFRYTMTGTTPEEGRIKAEASMRTKPDIAMSMKVTALDKGSEGSAEIRLVDEAMYLGGGAEAAKEMDGKSWLKFDLAGLGAGDQMNEGAAGQAQKNPATESTFLTGADDVKKVGTEKIDGVETTRYSGTITLDDLRAELKKKDAKAAERGEKSIQQYEKMGIETLTMDAWIDGEDHTKQFRMRGDATKGPLDMTIKFLDVNKPVTVEAPPAKDTMDLAEMMQGLEES